MMRFAVLAPFRLFAGGTMLTRIPTPALMILIALVAVSSCIGGNNTEANSEATKAWDSYFAKCGSSYFTTMGSSVCEYRSVSIKTEKSSLTESDKLNNIEWKGQSYFSAPAERCYSSRWSDWNSAGINLTISLTRKAGVWNVGKPVGTFVPFAPTLRKISCSDVPQ